MLYLIIASICFTIIAFSYGIALLIAQLKAQKNELELTRNEISNLNK